MMKNLLKKSLILLALGLVFTGCKDINHGSDSQNFYYPDPIIPEIPEEFIPEVNLEEEKKLAYDNYCVTFVSTAPFGLYMTASKYMDGKLFYSKDKINWTEWDYENITFNENVPEDNIYRIYLRGSGNTCLSNDSYSGKLCPYSVNQVYSFGNIMTLLDYTKVKNNQTIKMSDNCFYYLFNSVTELITAPDLPATTLAKNCYAYMFRDCTSLKIPPVISATTLAENCCESMFSGCKSLTTAPELPAKKLAKKCYSYMFYGCKSLTTAPELPATTLAEDCYGSMLRDCKSLTTIPDLPATTLASFCYNNMFDGCTNIKVYETKPSETYYEWTAPLNPNNYLGCYSYMFSGTGGDFTTAPKPGTTYYILRS